MDQINNVSNINTGSYTGTDFCGHRAPCGYCSFLGRMCPISSGPTTPTWTWPPTITCNGNEPKVTYGEE